MRLEYRPHGMPLPGECVVIRAGYVLVVAETDPVAVPQIFELRETEYESDCLSVFDDALTTLNDIKTVLPKSTFFAKCQVELIRQLRNHVTDLPLNVVVDFDGGTEQYQYPGGSGHCGIIGTFCATKGDRRRMRLELAKAFAIFGQYGSFP